MDLTEKVKDFLSESEFRGRVILGTKGQGTLDTVIAVVIGAVAIIIGSIICAELFEAIDTDSYSSAAQDAINTTETMTWTAFGILPISILVLGAVAVIAAVLILRGRSQ